MPQVLINMQNDVNIAITKLTDRLIIVFGSIGSALLVINQFYTMPTITQLITLCAGIVIGIGIFRIQLRQIITQNPSPNT